MLHRGITNPYPDKIQGRARHPYQNVCLLPYINLETLKSDPARFLTMLYNRLKNSPEQWAPFDNYLLDKQWKIGSLKTSYNKNCVVMHGPGYGNLTNWQARSTYAWDTIGFPGAILLLEAQMKLSQTLKSIVDELLAGGPEAHDSCSIDQALDLKLKKPTEKSSCVEFASSYINQPFSSPPAFDINSLLDIPQTQVNFHTDHLWLLQTDPLSLRNYATLVVEGPHNENLTIHNQHVFAALKMMEDAMTCWTWEWILQEVQHVQKLDLKFRDSIYPGSPLPPAYAQSLSCLEELLVKLLQRLASAAWMLLPFRPGFRKKWDVKYFQHLQSMAFAKKRKDNLDMIEFWDDDPLEFCLLSLASHLLMPLDEMVNEDEDYTWHEPSELFALLDDHLSKPGRKEDIARLDEVLYHNYSDLSAMHQMVTMVRLHRPFVSAPKFEEAAKTQPGKAWRYNRPGYVYLDQDHRVPQPKNTENMDEKINAQQALGNLMGEFLSTPKPTGARASQKWLDQEEAQRAASDRF